MSLLYFVFYSILLNIFILDLDLYTFKCCNALFMKIGKIHIILLQFLLLMIIYRLLA